MYFDPVPNVTSTLSYVMVVKTQGVEMIVVSIVEQIDQIDQMIFIWKDHGLIVTDRFFEKTIKTRLF